jgi:hypothetical protein
MSELNMPSRAYDSANGTSPGRLKRIFRNLIFIDDNRIRAKFLGGP